MCKSSTFNNVFLADRRLRYATSAVNLASYGSSIPVVARRLLLATKVWDALLAETWDSGDLVVWTACIVWTSPKVPKLLFKDWWVGYRDSGLAPLVLPPLPFPIYFLRAPSWRPWGGGWWQLCVRPTFRAAVRVFGTPAVPVESD